MKQQRSISFSAVISYDEAAKCYLAHCPILNLYSAGKTEAAAERAIMGAIQLWANLRLNGDATPKNLKRLDFAISMKTRIIGSLELKVLSPSGIVSPLVLSPTMLN